MIDRDKVYFAKIKFHIGGGEMINTFAYIWRNEDESYQLHFNDGVSYDNYVLFNEVNRYFYGI